MNGKSTATKKTYQNQAYEGIRALFWKKESN